MRNGLVLFSSDRGITPAGLARAAEERGFDTFYVPEHTHIPVKRTAAHPGTGDESLPDDRYTRTLDPWISLATAAAVTTRIGLSTAVALPVESDPITLAKAIATLDHLSGGRVTIGAGFGWNTDELEDHHVPAGRRRKTLPFARSEVTRSALAVGSACELRMAGADMGAEDSPNETLWNVSGRALLWFDVCRPNDPRPLFGVAGQKLSKLIGGTRR